MVLQVLLAEVRCNTVIDFARLQDHRMHSANAIPHYIERVLGTGIWGPGGSGGRRG